MADFTVTIDEDILDVLRAIAKLQGTTVEGVLRGMVAERVEQIRARMNDPLIGMVDSGKDDISERADNILRDEWQPD